MGRLLSEIMVEVGWAKSKREARRLIASGAITLVWQQRTNS